MSDVQRLMSAEAIGRALVLRAVREGALVELTVTPEELRGGVTAG